MDYSREFFDSVYAEGEGDPWGYWDSEYERQKGERAVSALAHRRDPDGITRVLDVGCGNGAKTAMVADAFPDAEVVGVDLSEEALAEAREETSGVSYECANVVDYVATVERSFDAVVAIGALHYLCADYSVTDLLAFADGLRSALSPDGLLVAAHNHMPRGGGPTFVQGRSVRALRTVLESSFEIIGRSCYVESKEVALDPEEPAEQPYEVWTMRPRSAVD